jgi:4-amino-4-deoxy-L-arabinose transferase-like glycosyltransferase
MPLPPPAPDLPEGPLSGGRADRTGRAAGQPGFGIGPGAPWRSALAFVAGVALLWVLVPALTQTVPHADNVEQLGWAHAPAWGYVKHPPLPTWLLAGAEQFLEPTATLTYALAMACVAGALLLLWHAARPLLGEAGAWAVLLLSSANYYLMGRGSFLNHNTVMLPWIAASAWAVMRLGRGASTLSWILLGLAQGLGLLTKYQMAIVIAANFAALLALGVHRRPGFLRGMVLATAATLLPLLPHLAWLQAHQFSSFGYAGHNLLADLPWVARPGKALAFLAQQIGRLAPALLIFAALAWSARRQLRPQALAHGDPHADAKRPAQGQALRAVAWLALLPIALILGLVLFAGVAPQNHWGDAATLLLPLLALVRWPAVAASPQRVLMLTLAVHALAAGWSVVAARTDGAFHHRFPATALAAQAQALWTARAGGAVPLVAGADWEAGSIALALPGHPASLPGGDPRQLPGFDANGLAACGTLLVWRLELPAADQLGAVLAAKVVEPQELTAPDPRGRPYSLMAAVVPPRGICPLRPLR